MYVQIGEWVAIICRICGAPPFRSKDEDTLYSIIKKAEVDFDDDAWKDVSENGRRIGNLERNF